MVQKKESEMIYFTIELHKATLLPKSAIGYIKLFDEYQAKVIGETAFNYWDEIPSKMRKLLRENKIKREYQYKDEVIAELH